MWRQVRRGLLGGLIMLMFGGAAYAGFYTGAYVTRRQLGADIEELLETCTPGVWTK